MGGRRGERVLVVEDNARLQRALAHALDGQFADVSICGTVATAREALRRDPPDLVLLDFELPDGDAFAILEVARTLDPAPVVVAMSGVAEPEQTFELARRGVRAFLPKPLILAAIGPTMIQALEAPPELAEEARHAVGSVPLPAALAGIRGTMIEEALARAKGSRRRAARLLGISRQALQYLLHQRK